MTYVNENEDFNPTQHCTIEGVETHYTFSHTVEYCGGLQPRACGCAYCYDDGVADLINFESSPRAHDSQNDWFAFR